MLKLLTIAAAGILLGGCVALSAVVSPAGGAAAGSGGAGFAAGYFSNPSNDLQIFNDALKVDAPLKALWCIQHESVIGPVLRAYCQHIPTDATQVLPTFIYMINAGVDGGAAN